MNERTQKNKNPLTPLAAFNFPFASINEPLENTEKFIAGNSVYPGGNVQRNTSL